MKMSHYFCMKFDHDQKKKKSKKYRVHHDDMTRVDSEEIKDEYKVDVSKLSIGCRFAHGAYSELFHGVYIDKNVAVKIVRDDDEKREVANKMKRQFNAEVSSLTRLHHPNIVKFVGACKERPFRVITEYLPQGSLNTYLHNNSPVPLQKIIKMALDIARGMEYVHAQGVMHKDLKSDNILIDDDFTLRIADFGVSCEEKNCNNVRCCRGTYRWMAPEMIKNEIYGRKVDVYSYGIILWEMLSGTIPYKELVLPIQVAVAVSTKNLRPTIPEDCPPPLRSLIQQCWSSEPENRPEFSLIVKVLERFESLIAIDGTLNLLQDSIFHDHKKKGFFHFVQKLGVCITCRDFMVD